eukprot:12546991-Ditylum_brightwellii.AAC.1
MVELDKWRTGACRQKRYPTRGYNTLRPRPQQKHTEKKNPKEPTKILGVRTNPAADFTDEYRHRL